MKFVFLCSLFCGYGLFYIIAPWWTLKRNRHINGLSSLLASLRITNELLETVEYMFSLISRRALHTLSSVFGRSTIRKAPPTSRNKENNSCDARKTLFQIFNRVARFVFRYEGVLVKYLIIVHFISIFRFYSEFDTGMENFQKLEPRNKIADQAEEILSCIKSQFIHFRV